MKLSLGVTCLAIAASSCGAAAQSMSVRGNTKSANKLMQNARQLQNNYNYNYNGNGNYNNAQYGGWQYGGGYNNGQQGGGGAGGNNENYFLNDYSIKLLTCTEGEPSYSSEGGKVEASTVVFRLCPVASCNATASALGCEEGYGDYAVGLNTFVGAYVESQRENYYSGLTLYNSYGEEFSVEEYSACKEFKREGENGNGQGGYYSYNKQYIGPACTSDGKGIRLGMFYDQYCSFESDLAFGSIAYGWSGLPFESGGLIPNQCMNCVNYNNYNWELSEMCQTTYKASASRCERNMKYYGSNGKSIYGCDYIDKLVSAVDFTTVSATSSNQMAWIHNNNYTAWIHNNTYTFYNYSLAVDEEMEIEGAVFVIMAIVGAVLMCCIMSCIQCKKVRKRSKVNAKYYEVTRPVLVVPDGPEMKRRVSTAVHLVKSATNTVKEASIGALATTKLVVAETAAKTVAAVKRARSNVSKTKEDPTVDETAHDVEGAANTDYSNMEDVDPIFVDESSFENVTTDKSSPSDKSVQTAKSEDSIKKTPIVITGSYNAPLPTPLAVPESEEVKTGMLVSLDEHADVAVPAPADGPVPTSDPADADSSEVMVSRTPASDEAKADDAAPVTGEGETSSEASPPVVVSAADADSKPASEPKATKSGWFSW
jgi:hypothetical protein